MRFSEELKNGQAGFRRLKQKNSSKEAKKKKNRNGSGIKAEQSVFFPDY